MAGLTDYFNFADISLSRITDQDIKPTVELINRAYSYQDKANGGPRTSQVRLRRRASESELYVAKHNNRLAGCVYVEAHDKIMLLGLLTVADEYRGSGLAPALLQAIEAYSKSLKLDGLELDYMSLAPWLKAYYERFGFKETGQVTAWGTIDLVRMRKTLPK